MGQKRRSDREAEAFKHPKFYRCLAAWIRCCQAAEIKVQERRGDFDDADTWALGQERWDCSMR